MTTPRSIDNYGGVFSDLFPVEDTTVEISSTFDNRLHEDAVQMTRTTDKVVVRFPTTATAPPVAVTPSAGQSHMGTGSGSLPTVGKVGVGLYDITYPSSWVDALGEVENIGFTFSSGRVSNLVTCGSVQITTVGSVIHVAVFNAAGTLSDLGGAITIEVDAK